MERIRVVLAKELIDNLRDGRSLSAALVYPLLGPLLLGVLIGLMANLLVLDRETTIHVAVQGAVYAPEMISHLESNGVVLEPIVGDTHDVVRRGRHASVLIVPAEFSEDFSAGRPAKVQVIMDSSRLASLVVVNQLLDLMRGYGREVAIKRLAQRQIEPEMLDPVRIEPTNVAVSGTLIDTFLSMIAPFIMFNIFIGGVYLTLDATSGERERRSFEPLLANPIARWEVMSGKVLAGVVFTLVAVLVQLIAFKLMFEMVGSERLSFSDKLDFTTAIGIFVVSAPLVLFAVAVQTIIATVTRSFKQALTYLGLLPLLPGLPGLLAVFVSFEAQSWMMVIPTFGQTVLIGQFVRGEPVATTHIAITIFTTLFVSLLLYVVAARLYEREDLIFGT